MAHHEIQVPYDEKGNLMHYANPHAQHGQPLAADRWEPPRSFRTTLHLRETRRGSSSAYFLFYDPAGHEFAMFISDVASMMQNTHIVAGAVVGTFIPVRRGRNYGVKYVGP